MLKINKEKFKYIDEGIDQYIEVYSKYFSELQFLDSLSVDAKKIFYTIEYLEPNHFIREELVEKLSNDNNDLNISEEDKIIIYNIVYLIDYFMDSVFIHTNPTLDEIEYAIGELFKRKALTKEQKKPFDDYLNIRRNFVNNIKNAYIYSNLDDVIFSLDKIQVEFARKLLGFEKKPNLLCLHDYSNFSLASFDYIYTLSGSEKEFSNAIDESIQRKEEYEEREQGVSFYKKIVQEFVNYIDYSISLIRTIENNVTPDTKEDLEKLKIASENISESYNELFKQEYILNEISSLDELILFREKLDPKYTWLKKAITDVVRRYNKRIINFNNSVLDDTYEEELAKLNYWQKLELASLREYPISETYIDTPEIDNFFNESIEILIDSIKQDEIDEARNNGYSDFDDYSIDQYKAKLKDDIIDFRDIYVLKFFKDEKWNR